MRHLHLDESELSSVPRRPRMTRRPVEKTRRRWLVLGVAFERPLKANETAYECVVARVRAVGRFLRKQVVKAVLGRREGPLDIEAEAPEPGRPYRDEE